MDATGEIQVKVSKRGDEFRPLALIRYPLAQSYLATRLPGHVADVKAGEQRLIVSGGADETGYDETVRLLAYYNRRFENETGDGEPGRGLVVTLHGWEGSSHAAFNLVTTHALLSAGYDVVRLNLRDHGPPGWPDVYALNRGVFLATLLDEVSTAITRIAELAGSRPVHLVGPSLGGNFVLRVAAHRCGNSIPNLGKVIAVSPAVNPARATELIDIHPVYHRYFGKRWRRSLAKKAARFPALYDFAPALAMGSLREMTDWLVRHYTPYRDADDYFERYAVTPATLAEPAAPVTIIAAADDPVIAVDDIVPLGRLPMVDLRYYPHGGHVGFVALRPPRHRLPRLILEILARE